MFSAGLESEVIFEVAEALRVPVLILTVLALGVVLVEQTVDRVAWSASMGRTLRLLVGEWGKPDAESMMAKALAEHDFGSLRRLERTRLLVRAGPALGLMGTLIPLSPALAGLAAGDVQELSENLRVPSA